MIGQGIKINFFNANLWQRFNGNAELMVTKKGSNLTPWLAFGISGLHPDAAYELRVAIDRTDGYKYKYDRDGKRWLQNSNGEPIVANEGVPHAAGIQKGSYWMARPVDFHIKLTTDSSPENLAKIKNTGVLVTSLHRYIPVLHIYKIEPEDEIRMLAAKYSWDQTTFIVVKKYMSDLVINLRKEMSSSSSGKKKRQAAIEGSNGGGEPAPKVHCPSPPTIDILQIATDELFADMDVNKFIKTINEMAQQCIKMIVLNEEMWGRFNGNIEMKIVKKGGNLAPLFTFGVEGLQPNEKYTMTIIFDRNSDFQYRYDSEAGKWMPQANAQPVTTRLGLGHLDGLQDGAHWMSKAIAFPNAKVTTGTAKPNQFRLETRHRYVPNLRICRLIPETGEMEVCGDFRSSLLEFMAVSEYSTREVAELKMELSNYNARNRKRRAEGGKSQDLRQPMPKQQPQPMQEEHQREGAAVVSPRIDILKIATDELFADFCRNKGIVRRKNNSIEAS